jgi:hypothetical protein
MPLGHHYPMSNRSGFRTADKILAGERSAVGCLAIYRRFTRQKHERARQRHDARSQGSTAHRLTIGAVAYRRRFRIRFGLERHVAAMTASIDFHGIPAGAGQSRS